MRTKISITLFILNAILGSLGLGANLDDVRGYLGAPDDIGKGIGKVRINRYFGGSLEISFLNDKVVLFAIYLTKGILGENSDPELLTLDVPKDLSTNETLLVEWLSTNGLSTSLIVDDGSCKSWKVNNGVVLTFVDAKLDSIQLS